MTASKTKTTKAIDNVVKPKQLAKLKAIDTTTEIGHLTDRRFFPAVYAIVSLLVLLATTLIWSIVSAKLQNSNADQIIDPYLFQHGSFPGANFPGAHSFLLKWPLFWLIGVIGVSPAKLILFTVLTVLVTVAGLVFILWRIERRPLVFGTICLALASVLLLVPAQPNTGVLLPVNMAMLATRNLEYLVFIAGLALIVRWARLRSWQFWVGIGCVALVAASDKLFLILSGGGALLALIMYSLVDNARLLKVMTRWLVASLAAGVLTIVIVAIAGHATHILGQSSNGPYGLTTHPKDLAVGAIYAVVGLFSNFGANPAYGALEVKQLPHATLTGLRSVAGPAYIINALILLLGLWAVWKLCLPAIVKPHKTSSRINTTAEWLSTTLVWVSLVAFGVFVVTNHYYAVDARYLTIVLFALFITGAAYLRRRTFTARQLTVVGGVLCIGIVCGLLGIAKSYPTNHAALEPIDDRNSLVSQALAGHPVHSLIGDYWRVLPIRLESKGQQNVIPLSSCTTVAPSQTSTTWQANWQHRSFAYLLSLQKGLTGYPACALQQVTAAYGHPNASVLIAGSYAKPQELLLFYDHGVNLHTAGTHAGSITTTVAPITADQLSGTNCAGPSVMNIVAHEDDDLLFMNPDLLHSIEAGYCVRTIYVTAGDAGSNKFYWLGREAGSEAAYDTMDGPDKDIWIQRTVQLNVHEFVTVANPRGNQKISLIFMHLPDGNINGSGFPSSGNESLAKLLGGNIGTIRTVDGQSSYGASDLTNALVTLMHLYEPSDIRTQSPTNMSEKYPDHSDHLAVGQLTRKAYMQYEQEQYASQVTIPISYYIGYPIRAMGPNVSGDDLEDKQAAFFAYGKNDDGVCSSADQCSRKVYGIYLSRQYDFSGQGQ